MNLTWQKITVDEYCDSSGRFSVQKIRSRNKWHVFDLAKSRSLGYADTLREGKNQAEGEARFGDLLIPGDRR